MNRIFPFCVFFVLSLILVGCKDEVEFPLPEPATFKSTLNHYGFPVLEIYITQRLGEKQGENLTYLNIKNIGSESVKSIKYLVSVFTSSEKIIENYEYFYTHTIESIEAGDTTGQMLINSSSGLILTNELTEIVILSIGNDGKYGHVYEGIYKAYSDSIYTTLNLTSSDRVNGSITADGYLNIKLAGKGEIKTIAGFIDDDEFFSGEALTADGTHIADLTSFKKLSTEGDTLNIELFSVEDDTEHLVISLSKK